jgi:REP element-mobilizing transposase RayT
MRQNRTGGFETRPNRRSLRLQDYDYSQAGAYFVTICANNRQCLFGDVVDGEMVLNDAEQMIDKWWAELNRKFPTVQTDEHVIMPNHFHGIITINSDPVGADLGVCPNDGESPCAQASGAHIGAPLPEIIQWFKTMTTNEYIHGVKTSGWPSFRGRLWQRNYYEHTVHNEESLNRIREYIINNPLQWAYDRENPVGAKNISPLPKDEPWRI